MKFPYGSEMGDNREFQQFHHFPISSAGRIRTDVDMCKFNNKYIHVLYSKSQTAHKPLDPERVDILMKYGK